MKLLLCTECNDLVYLAMQRDRACECGKTSGQYTDNKKAVVRGPCIPIGFHTGQFVEAVQNQPEEGIGLRFDAFVIPKTVDNITHESD